MEQNQNGNNNNIVPPPVQPQPSQAQPTPAITVNQGSKKKIPKIVKILGIILGIFSILALIAFIAVRFLGFGQPEIITLNYWGTWEEKDVMQRIINDFEAQNPTIKINYEKQDVKGLGRYVERLKTRINQGNGPDIYSFHSSWTLQLNDYLTVFPQEFVASTGIDTDYYNTVKRDLNLNGGYYGIPLYIDTLALFTNNQLLDLVSLQPPNEWNDITRVYSPALLVKEGRNIITSSIALGTYDNIAHASDIASMIFLQNGADLFDLYGERRQNSEGALQFYRSFAQGSGNTWDVTLDNSKDAFAKGSLAMYFGYARDINEIRNVNPNLQFRVSEAPKLVNVKSTVASYWAEGVSSKTKHREAAFAFLAYLSQPATLEKLNFEHEKVAKVGLVYPRRSMQKNLEGNEILYPFALQADDARTTFFTSDTFDGDDGMITVMNGYLKEAIDGLGEASSTSRAIEILAQRIEEVLKTYAQ